MPTPQINIRVPDRFHDLMRRIAVSLRENPALAATLEAVCDGSPPPESSLESSPESSPRLEALEARVEALERLAAGRADAPAPAAPPKVYPKRGQNKRATPEPLLVEAQRLKDGGMTLAQIVDELKLTIDKDSLKNALWKRRKAAAAPGTP